MRVILSGSLFREGVLESASAGEPLPRRINSNKFMKKLDIQLITAAVLAIGGLIMLFCGVYIEPLGQIHESLLIGFGEVATFAGALFGIDYTYKMRNGGSKTS